MLAILAEEKVNRRYCHIRNLFLALSLSVIAGCSVPTHVILFNNSLNDISIEFKNDDRNLERVTINSHQKIKIKGLLEMGFSINSNSSLKTYAMSMGDISSYIEQIGFGPFFERVAKAQLEDNGCIYLVDINVEFPMHELGKQPEGFPLCAQK